MDYDDYFEDHDAVRLAIASYYALVSFLFDDNVGKVLAALDAAGLTETTASSTRPTTAKTSAAAALG